MKSRFLSVFIVFLLVFSLVGLAAPPTQTSAAVTGVVKLTDPATNAEKTYYSLATGHNTVRIQVSDADLNLQRVGRARYTLDVTQADPQTFRLGDTNAPNPNPTPIIGGELAKSVTIAAASNPGGDIAVCLDGTTDVAAPLDCAANTGATVASRGRDANDDGALTTADVSVTIGGVAKTPTSVATTGGWIAGVVIAAADNTATQAIVVSYESSEYNQVTTANTPVATASILFGQTFATATSSVTVASIDNSTGLVSGVAAIDVDGPDNVNANADDNDSLIIVFAYDVGDTISSVPITSTRAAALAQPRTVNLTESGPATGIFRGDIILTSDPADANFATRLIVSHGDTITVTYTDASPVGTITDTALVDLTAPTITLIGPANKSYTNIQVFTFSVDIVDADSGVLSTSIGFTPPTGVSVNLAPLAPIAGGFRVTATPTASIAEGAHKWALAFTDNVGNDPTMVSEGKTAPTAITDPDGNTTINEGFPLGTGSLTTGNPYTVTVDIVRPVVSTATTGIAAKLNTTTGAYEDDAATLGTAKNAVKLVFSAGSGGAPLDAATVAVDDFTVGGATPLSLIVQTNTVYLTVVEMATDAKPVVAMVGSVSDKATNALTTAAAAADRQVTAADGLKPVMTVAAVGTGGGGGTVPVSKSTFTITVTATETLPGGPVVQAGVDAGCGDLGTASTCTFGATGKAPDGDLLDTDVDGVVESTVGADLNGDGDFLDTVDNVNETTALIVNVTMAAVGVNTWQGTLTIPTGQIGKRTVAVAGTDIPGNVGRTSLVVEKDIAVPAPTVTPAAASTVTTQNPWITVAFTAEGAEYGTADTHKKVTLTSATLNSVNVLSKFFTPDSITYTMAASGLSLGSQSLALGYTDVAGNTGTTTVAFTVAAKPAISIALAPGWNLISVPAPLDDPSVSSVFAGMTTVSRIYGFDAATGWQLSTFDAATGTWSGSLSSIKDGKGYWVFSSAFVPIKVFTAERQPTSPLPEYSLKAGWNLVGFTGLAGETTMNVGSYLASLGTRWTSLISFSPDPAVGYQTAKTNAIFSAAFDAVGGVAQVTRGKGYWIFLTADGALVP